MKPIRKAIFPVAGLGTRFLPATKAMPKEMLTVVDRPLIQHVVDEAKEAAGRHARQNRGEISGRKADHWIVGIEACDDHLADVALGHRLPGSGANDLDDHMLVDDHARGISRARSVMR